MFGVKVYARKAYTLTPAGPKPSIAHTRYFGQEAQESASTPSGDLAPTPTPDTVVQDVTELDIDFAI